MHIARIIALALFVFSLARTSRAHDLAIDELQLSPRFEQSVLRGQIQFDPELTRKKGELPSPAAEQRVLAFLRRNLKLELDGKVVAVHYSVRELWVPGGATGGDLVVLDAKLPKNARELRVFVPEAMKALVVTIQTVKQEQPATTRSTLVLGGAWSALYRFNAEASPQSWREGGAEQFNVDGGVAASAEPSAAPVTSPPPSPTPSAIAEGRARAEGDFEAQSAWHEAIRYLVVGIEHILPRGWDHVLFVVGLVLGSGRRYKQLLLQLSAFTFAHSVTLALGAFGLVVLPSSIIEPLIALSISYVAVENLIKRGEPKYRALIVLCFGLLHGQGFARALADLELPREAFVAALVGFNLGVEVGQLIVVAAVLLALYWLKSPPAFRRYAVVPGSLCIAAIGLYWGVDRIFG